MDYKRYYISAKLLKHEITRIMCINRPDAVPQARAKVDLMDDLNIISQEDLTMMIDHLVAVERAGVDNG